MIRVDVAQRLAELRAELTPVDRRIADILLTRPEALAFGTVAAVAEQAETSGASVVRFAAKLGYQGFSDLQREVRETVASNLRPATERIRQHAPSDILEVSRSIETANVEATIDAVDRTTLIHAVDLLCDTARPLLALAGDAAAGVVAQVTKELQMIRPGVRSACGSTVAVARELAHLGPDHVVLVVDLPRYDEVVLDGTRLARAQGAAVVVLTDRPMSPLADGAEAVFSVQAAGVGPFDSYVGALALLNLFVAAVSQRLQRSATDRIDRIEAAWAQMRALADPGRPPSPPTAPPTS